MLKEHLDRKKIWSPQRVTAQSPRTNGPFLGLGLAWSYVPACHQWNAQVNRAFFRPKRPLQFTFSVRLCWSVRFNSQFTERLTLLLGAPVLVKARLRALNNSKSLGRNYWLTSSLFWRRWSMEWTGSCMFGKSNVVQMTKVKLKWCEGWIRIVCEELAIEMPFV